MPNHGVPSRKTSGRKARIRRRPSYHRRRLLRNISQSIQSHINRLAQPVARKPVVSESPFAFLTQRLMAMKKPESVVKWLPGPRASRKIKKRKGKQSARKSKRRKEMEVRDMNLLPPSGLGLPTHLSASIATFEKARVYFLQSLTNMHNQIASLKLPITFTEPSSNQMLNKQKKLPKQADAHGAATNKEDDIKMAPPPTNAMPPRPKTPSNNQSTNIHQLFGPKLRRLLNKAAETSETWMS